MGAGFNRRTEDNSDDHLSRSQRRSQIPPGRQQGAIHRQDPYSGDVYFLRARLNVSLPGLEREVAQGIVDATHKETYAYSNATRGNVDVTLNVV